MNKQTKEINTIHAMSPSALSAEADALRTELRGYMPIEERTHKTNKLQLVQRYLDIRTAREVKP